MAPTGSDSAAMLRDLSSVFHTTFRSLEEFVDVCLPMAMRHLGMSTAFLAEVTPLAMNLLGAVDDAQVGLAAGVSEPLRDTFCQYVRDSGAAVIVPNSGEDARVAQVGARAKYNIGSYLGAPVRLSDGSFYGTLCTLDPDPHDFTDEQVAFLNILAGKAAQIVEHQQKVAQLALGLEAAHQDLMTTFEALDSQTRMLRIVAHDLDNPVTAIIGFTQLLSSGIVGAVSPEQRQMLAVVSDSARFINRMAQDLSLSAALQSGTISLLNEEYIPADFAAQMVEQYQLRAQQLGKPVAVSLELRQPPVTCIGDRMRVRQALSNLMTNALRYTPEGSVTLIVDGDDEYVRFSVRDTGPGIPEEQQERIWQFSTRATRDTEGYGIGLFVVRQLVEKLGGTIGLESTVGEGSTFTIQLPLTSTAPQNVALD